MAEKQKILELDLGTDAVIAKSKELKDSISSTREELDKMKKSGEGNSESAIKLEAALKKLQTQYSYNQKVVQALVNTSGQAIPVQQKVNLLLEQENTTRAKAKNSITELNKLRDELNVNVKEEADLMDKLNKKIDENAAFLRKTGSEEDKRVMNIGNYKQGIIDAFDATGQYSGQLSVLNKVYETGTTVLNPFIDGIVSSAKGMKTSAVETEGMTAAQSGLTVATNIGTGAMRIFALAVAATGVGLIVIAIALLIGYLKSLDPVMDKVEQGFSAVGGVIEFLEEKIGALIDGISSVGDAFSKFGSFLLHPIDSLKSLGKGMADAAREAANLKAREQDLEDQMNVNSILNKRQESEIARLMIQAKDRSKSAAEQNAAFQKAEDLNAAIFDRNKAAATEQLNIAIDTAKKKKKLSEDDIEALKKLDIERATILLNEGKIRIDAYKKLQEAFNANIEIENQYNEQLDKITTKKNNAIEKQQAAEDARRTKEEEARKKALSDASALAKAELDLLISSQGIKAKTLDQEVKLAEQVRDKKLKIAQADYDASAKTQADKLKLLVDQNNAENELLQKQTDAVVGNANRELNAFIDANKSKIDANKFFSDALLQQEESRLNSILERQLAFEQLRFEQGLISETEYQDAIKKVQDEYQAQKDEAEATRKAAVEEQKVIDLENQRAYEDIVFQDNYQIQQDRLEQQRLAEIAAAEKNGASIDLINKKYKAAAQKLDSDYQIAKLEGAQKTIGTIGALMSGYFGENKQLSAALASVDMFLGIQKAYLSQLIPGDPTSVPRAILAGAQAGAFGLLNVAKISGAKFAEGGMLNGPSHDNGGIPFTINGIGGFEAEGGEAIINKRSTSMFAPLLSLINQIGGGKKFATGGMVNTSGIVNSLSSGNSNSAFFDYDMLASKIAQANGSLPVPVLPIEHFHNVNNQYVQAVNGANHG